MASVPPEGRKTAQRYSKLASACGLSLGATAPVAAALGSVLTGPLGLAAALAAVLAWRTNQLANDPPAFDYRRKAVARPLKLRLDLFPANQPGRGLAALTQNLALSDAHLGATLRAFERSQGAAIDRDLTSLKVRLSETERHAHAAARVLQQQSALLSAEHVEGFDLDSMAREKPRDTPTIGLGMFDDRTLAFLYLSGLPLSYLERAFEGMALADVGPEPPRTALESLGPAAMELAAFLDEWRPEIPAA